MEDSQHESSGQVADFDEWIKGQPSAVREWMRARGPWWHVDGIWQREPGSGPVEAPTDHSG